VFLTFPRVVLEAASYEDAKRICVERGWKKPSIQSWGMRHRILEIESLAVADERIVEVHPEVSFRELFGQPLSKKRDATGLAERKSTSARRRRSMLLSPALPMHVRTGSSS
jgi:predicted RNase H-like nuclease